MHLENWTRSHTRFHPCRKNRLIHGNGGFSRRHRCAISTTLKATYNYVGPVSTGKPRYLLVFRSPHSCLKNVLWLHWNMLWSGELCIVDVLANARPWPLASAPGAFALVAGIAKINAILHLNPSWIVPRSVWLRQGRAGGTVQGSFRWRVGSSKSDLNSYTQPPILQ